MNTEAQGLIYAINEHIINPVVLVVFAVALVVFLYGLVEFIAKADGDEGRSKGQRHMLYGLLGLFVMFTVFGIINFILATLGIADEVNLIFF